VDLSTATAADVAARFALAGPVRAVTPLSGGHINASWRVAAGGGAYLLQRLNDRVFPEPMRVMENVSRVCRHLGARLRAEGARDPERRALTLVPTRDGADWMVDGDCGVWRCLVFVDGVRTHDRAASPDIARAAARAFGEFLRLLDDYGGPPLHATIPGFHDTARRLTALEVAARADPQGRAAGVGSEIAAILAHRDLAEVLPPLLTAGAIPLRVAHHDAKIANVLFDGDTGEALCVIDLDTVMPGTVLYDFGDLVRSMASPAAEDETDLERVGVREDFFAAVAAGWLEGAGTVVTRQERELMVFAGRLFALEQAARFLTDYLEGDRYYRVARAGHNLDRARNQLHLFESLTRHEAALRRIVERLP
jgi:hypothetical protein